MHILSPETDNCPSWISGRDRMTVENISWSISTKECCRPRRWLNPRPPGLQSDGASNWATEAGRYACWYFCYILNYTWHTCILKQSSTTSGMHVIIFVIFWSALGINWNKTVSPAVCILIFLLYFKGHLAYIETKQYHQRYACWYFCYILKYTWHILKQSSFVCLFVLRFYGPVNLMQFT